MGGNRRKTIVRNDNEGILYTLCEKRKRGGRSSC